LNVQELGKFVAYKDAVFIMPFIEGRGLPHDFSKYRNNATFNNAKWLKGGKFIQNSGDQTSIPNHESLRISEGTVMIDIQSRMYYWSAVLDFVDYGTGGTGSFIQ